MSVLPTGPDAPPRAEVLDLLADGELKVLGLMPHASNYTFLSEITRGDRTALAVYKPRAGETPLWDFPDGTLCRREVAAFVLSEALGWPDIPPTILRDGPHGPGAVQLFVRADPGEHFFTLRDGRLDAFRPVAAFDVIANNADRKGGHCLLDPASGTIWLVDHGVCFSDQPKLRTVIWDFSGERIPKPLVGDIKRVASEVRSGPLAVAMAALLTDEEVETTARRAEALAASGRFPPPGPGRPYPWPPV